MFLLVKCTVTSWAPSTLKTTDQLGNAMATTSTTNSLALGSSSARHHLLMGPRGVLSVIAALALLALSCWFAEVRPAILFRPATSAAVWKFLSGLFPPDVSL